MGRERQENGRMRERTREGEGRRGKERKGKKKGFAKPMSNGPAEPDPI